jgi:hypothetical protein
MDFYNFEKYNDVFCFEKLSNDYQPLLRIYEDNYKTSLNGFLKEYEENTELRFIESQLYFCTKEINVQKSIITSLEKIDLETFYYVRNRIGEKYCVYAKIQGDPFENKTQTTQTTPENSKNDDFKELKAPAVIVSTNDNDDDEALDTYATAKNFIKFISNRITSLCLIDEFLEKRKQELERGLITILSTVPEPEPLDLSDTSGVEKIIYLNELGIIDFLRTKTKAGISNGGLASVLSGITGIKAETIKPSLNRLSNNDIIDNKHPYYTTKTVEKIKTFLIKLGF